MSTPSRSVAQGASLNHDTLGLRGYVFSDIATNGQSRKANALSNKGALAQRASVHGKETVSENGNRCLSIGQKALPRKQEDKTHLTAISKG